MASHRAQVRWTRSSADFLYDTYNRAHVIAFKDGALTLPGSSAPQFKGDAERVDPEEAFVASLSACHMLTFLAVCARKRITVDAYADDAEGFLEAGEGGRLWMARVELRPKVIFAPGQEPAAEVCVQLHHQAHAACFIANSVKTDVRVIP